MKKVNLSLYSHKNIETYGGVEIKENESSISAQDPAQ
jgi:hypothetical protein